MRLIEHCISDRGQITPPIELPRAQRSSRKSNALRSIRMRYDASFGRNLSLVARECELNIFLANG